MAESTDSQNTKMPVRNIAWIIGISALIGAYVVFSSPDEIVVNDSGEAEGVINNIRANVQGGRFWIDQLNLLNADLEWELKEPQRRAEMENEMKQMELEMKKEDEEYYRQNPDLRPSRTEVQAERLRERADEIEMAEFEREMEQMRIENIRRLRHLISIVKPKAK